jgi:CRP/FNR family cyclic AMP-dependent transcriptional regulator
MEESAALALGVTKLIGLRRKRIERRLKSLLFRSNRDRLIHLLLDLAEQYGERTAEGVLLGIKLSHQDLAAVIGATRETVTVLLGELQLDGFLKVSRQRIVIRAIDRLAGVAEMTVPQIKLADNSPREALPRSLPVRQKP